MFPLLDRAAAGEVIEILHKGVVIHVTSQRGSTKLSRAKRQHALLVDPDSIVHSDPELLQGMEREFNRFGGIPE